jgi:hypothetical protein
MAWGSYIVLAATILVAASGIVSCAMRRTLVSRKARKRRIAENAEMNGENFYNRQGGTNMTSAVAENNTLVNGAPGADKLPGFATFEMTKPGGERTSDERIPLTNRSPVESSANVVASGGNGYGPPQSSGNGSPPRPGRDFDEYGNPLPPPILVQGAYGQGSQSRDQSLNRQYSGDASRGRGMAAGGYRGRGGYPPNGRGGYGQGQPRGGYGGPPRGGGYGQPRGGFAPRGRGGPPPPGYGPPQSGANYIRNQSPAAGYRGPSPARVPVPNYSEQKTYVPMQSMPTQTQGYTPFRPEEDRSSVARAESPPPLPGFIDAGPVGQAVEMDASTGSPSHAPRGYGFGPLRESDGDVAGMVGLQQQLQQQRDGQGRQTMLSDTTASRYSTDE